ncbi:hypothetical protein [Flagellimonas flava]|uniref:Uncharacterized protein n=1 Tax=Flagellimonas flava TaxID=570519 RepID=A0A1M5N7J7_9FLAO|nr:hypothetical protein [Allomuricauda flava]SHG85445.1 hypothetical protein SAMN04488116_2699 [Allomuricauda flava]
MKKEKPYINLDNPKEDLRHLQTNLNSIDGNMIAIALDYKYYLDSNFVDSEIYNLRDRIVYRLRATDIHFRMVINLLTRLDSELTDIHRTNNSNDMMVLHSHFFKREIDISAISDSILFHLISGFDYVSSLVSFVTGNKKKLKWVGLAKSARDSSKKISADPLGKIIDTLDRDFIGKLYDHRSTVIHLKNEIRPTSLSIDFMNAIVTTKIIASSEFTKRFHVLKKQGKENDLSLVYVMMWLLGEATKAIIKIQFGLKDYMERNKVNEQPFMFLKGPNNEILPPSTSYWTRPF